MHVRALRLSLVVCVVFFGACGDDDDDDDMPPVDGPAEDSSGSDAPTIDAPNTACTPWIPRAQAPELLVGPTGLEGRLLERIDAAQASIDVLMYQLSRDSFVDAFIRAAQRGVTVRLVLDRDQGVNSWATQQLTNAGIEVRQSSAGFEHFHAKVLVIDLALDRREGIVLSGNLNDYTMVSERNYGVIDLDLEDVADLESVFEADWNSTWPDMSCSRLIVSPINSRADLLMLINGATSTLDLEVMYLSDDAMRTAVEQKADAGVAVRVLLADPAWIDGNVETAQELVQHGISVKYLKAWELHAKLLVADGVAFIGSQNFSWTSLNKNREVGIFLTEETRAGASAQFDADWGIGAAAP